jgi:hypothetical protein
MSGFFLCIRSGLSLTKCGVFPILCRNEYDVAYIRKVIVLNVLFTHNLNSMSSKVLKRRIARVLLDQVSSTLDTRLTRKPSNFDINTRLDTSSGTLDTSTSDPTRASSTPDIDFDSDTSFKQFRHQHRLRLIRVSSNSRTHQHQHRLI